MQSFIDDVRLDMKVIQESAEARRLENVKEYEEWVKKEAWENRGFFRKLIGL